MGFKMKGPSTHKGTLRHKLETEQHHEQIRLNRSMDQTSLPDGRPGVSPFQYKGFDIDLSGKSKDSGSSLVDYARKKREEKSKLSLTPKKEKKKEPTREEKRAKRKADRKAKQEARDLERAEKRGKKSAYKESLKSAKDIAKKENKRIKEERKAKEKQDKADKLEKKRADKVTKALMKRDKPGTVVSRTAKKIGSKLNPWSKENKEKRAKRKAAEAADPEGTLAKKKARSTKIADSIEYLFMDGARPDDRAAARKATEMANRKAELKLKKYEEKQNKHTDDAKDTEKEEQKIYDHKKAKKIWDPKNPDTNMKDFAIGSEGRKAEYDRRKWKYDETIKGYNRDGTKKR
tara:strand:- start:1080 stop:2120 length:1041 start_codon:yes stop_codon:yes gene_type:complete